MCFSSGRYPDRELAERRRMDSTWHLFDRGAREPAPVDPIVAEEGLLEPEEPPKEVVTSS